MEEIERERATGDQKKLLFVCIGNTCRSQMAEGFARHYGGSAIKVRSAGTDALGYVYEGTARAMKEAGIDISAQSSDQLNDADLCWTDVVITLGCSRAAEFCPPSFIGTQIDWPVEDPFGKPFEVMIRVRDEIESRVLNLLSEA